MRLPISEVILSQQLPVPQREKLIEVLENLADVQQGLYYAIEFGRPRNKRTLDVTPNGLAKRLRKVADRLDGLARQQNYSEESEISHQGLVEDLLRAADNTEQLLARAAEVENIPLPVRAVITEHLIQNSHLIRLLARQIDHDGEGTANTPNSRLRRASQESPTH